MDEVLWGDRRASQIERLASLSRLLVVNHRFASNAAVQDIHKCKQLESGSGRSSCVHTCGA